MNYIYGAFILVSVLKGSAVSYAGGDSSGGGNLVICTKETGEKTYDPLEFFEGAVEGVIPQLGGADASLDEKRNIINRRLINLSPIRALIYNQALQNFDLDSKFLDEDLPSAGDSGEVTLPANCVLKQAVLQPKTPELPFKNKYFIDRRLWARLNNDQKIGMMLHEIIYYEMRTVSPDIKTSEIPRKFNMLILSGQIERFSLRDLINYLAKKDWYSMTDSRGFYVVSGSSYNAYYDNNNLRVLKCKGHDYEKKGWSVPLKGGAIQGCNTVEFYPSGNIKLIQDTIGNIFIQGRLLSVRVNLKFSPQGALVRATLGKSSYLRKSDGTIACFQAGDYNREVAIIFDTNENVVDGIEVEPKNCESDQ